MANPPDNEWNPKTKHTPGPWDIMFDEDDEATLISMASHRKNPGNYMTIHVWKCDVPPDEEGPLGPEHRANTRLIANAPRLLAAAVELLLAEPKTIPTPRSMKAFDELRAAVHESLPEREPRKKRSA